MRRREKEERMMYITSYRQYKTLLREVKRKEWEEKLTSLREEDMFGEEYEIIKKKNKTTTVLGTLKKDNGEWTNEIEEALDILIQTLILDDKEEKDTEEQKLIRQRTTQNIQTYLMEEIRLEELTILVENAIKKMKNKKAPGKDGIKVEVI